MGGLPIFGSDGAYGPHVIGFPPAAPPRRITVSELEDYRLWAILPGSQEAAEAIAQEMVAQATAHRRRFLERLFSERRTPRPPI